MQKALVVLGTLMLATGTAFAVRAAGMPRSPASASIVFVSGVATSSTGSAASSAAGTRRNSAFSVFAA